MSPLRKASLEMKAERSSGHGGDLQRDKNGVLALSVGVRIRRAHSKRSCAKVFPLYGRRGLVSGTGEMQGAGSVPSPGMIIFFDWDHDGASDHVGIVESCDGTTVHTIEGNSGDAVKQNSYTVNSQSILGYGLVTY